MARYGEKAQESVKHAIEKMKKGKLKSGMSGKTVRNPKQAIAIGLSEARAKGAKVPPPKNESSSGKSKKDRSKKTISNG